MARALWLRDRGVAELRGAALTLTTMALLGAGSMYFDPASGDFDRIVKLATPLAIILALIAWSPAASRIGRSHAVRLFVGPLVVVVAIVGCGVGDVATLQLPPAGPLILLAMAFAAMTPGYPIAAAIVTGTSLAILVAHAQVVAATGLGAHVADEFTIGFIVTILASAGMAIVVRVAADAEGRATRLAARSRERVDVLERVNRIVARFDGSQPIRTVIQAVVDDIAREFEITLVSLYLPFGRDQLTMVGVAGYPAPFHEIEIGVGIIGRAAASQRVQFVPDVLQDPDYRAARDDVRSEVAAPVVHSGELLGVVNFEGTLEHPIGPAQVALAEMVVHSLSAALRSARLDDERRDRLYAIERVLDVSRALVADLDRPRIVASIVDAVAELLAADVVALFSRRVDGSFRLEAGVGFPARAIGLEVSGRSGMVGRAIVARTRIDGLQEVTAWPAEFLDDRPGGSTSHAAMALPIEVGDEIAAVLFVTRIGPDRAYSALERGIADLLTSQVAIALQNADLHAQVAESALRDPLTGLPQSPVLRRGGRGRARQRPSSRDGAEPDRPRSRPLLGGQQRAWPRRRRHGPPAGRACDQGRRPRGRHRRPLRRRGVRGRGARHRRGRGGQRRGTDPRSGRRRELGADRRADGAGHDLGRRRQPRRRDRRPRPLPRRRLSPPRRQTSRPQPSQADLSHDAHSVRVGSSRRGPRQHPVPVFGRPVTRRIR